LSTALLRLLLLLLLLLLVDQVALETGHWIGMHMAAFVVVACCG
jgi:hypothetical protein